ncbi:hypothetical protein VTN77DRAFT_4884 [Rasamsonia byssochlamydoides]|uniref:uncharacterized protein n=1 Tax=Rasamsonia byssochlamydoides TaxID=89139 RepID=UPI003743E52B
MAASYISIPRSSSRSPSPSPSPRPIPLRGILTEDIEAAEVEYAADILDDHPLRSYPRKCCPGLSYIVQAWYRVAWKNWNERLFRLVCVLLMILGVIQCLGVLSNGLFYFVSGDYDWREGWEAPQQDRFEFTRWPSEFGQSMRCISHHNRALPDPVNFAINAGCTGARVDIWLYNNEILVGSSVQSLDTRYTLKDRYLDPLLSALKSKNPSSDKTPVGVFDEPTRSFVLILDFRSLPGPLWPHVVSQLSGLRAGGYLTHMKGSQLIQRPVTVVVSGRVPLAFVTAIESSHRDIFFDASLDELVLESRDRVAGYSSHQRRAVQSTDNNGSSGSETRDQDVESLDSRIRATTVPDYNAQNSFSASASFRDSIGFPRRNQFSSHQMNLIRQHIQEAHRHGLKARYYDIPGRRGLRELIWHTLAQEGADLIDVDGFWDRSAGRGWPLNSQVS